MDAQPPWRPAGAQQGGLAERVTENSVAEGQVDRGVTLPEPGVTRLDTGVTAVAFGVTLREPVRRA